MPNLTGQSIGRYHILEQLGEGGMATVYKAYDTRLERNVAFKVLRTDLFGQAVLEQVLKRFEREAKSLAKLSHHNIVNILDYGEHEEMPYLVMEYLPGGTLKQRLGKKIHWREAIQILIPVARGLTYAHQHAVIHRDVKPANVLMKEGNIPVLTDFGIAKLLEGTEGHTLTASGVGIGTPEYMAPEQGIGASTIDARADIYSLGIVLYEMITGRKPYIADTPMAVVLKQMTDPLPRPSDFVPDLPENVEHILLKALAKEPDDRYADMNSMIAAMESTLAATVEIATIVDVKESEATFPATLPSQKLVKKKAAPLPKPSPRVVMAVIGVVLVVLVITFGAPWIKQKFSSLPVAETILTKTSAPPPTPSRTVMPPSAIPATPPVMPTPDPSIQSAYKYIQDNKPLYERTFEFAWDREFYNNNDETKIENGKLIVTSEDKWGRGYITPPQGTFGSDMYTVEFEFRRLDANLDGQCTLYYGGKNGYITAEFFSNGRGNLSVTEHGEIASYNYDTSTSNTVTMINLGDKIAGFMNGQLMYIAINIKWNAVYDEQFFQSNSAAVCEFDNYKYWDLSELDVSATTETTAESPAGMSNFSEPILTYISNNSPTFEDNFSTKKAGWGNNSEGMAIFDLLENGHLSIRDGIDPNHDGPFLPDFKIPGVAFPTTGLFDASDFALQFRFQFGDTKNINLQLRSAKTINTGYRFTLEPSGHWELESSEDTILLAEGDQGIGAGYNKVLVIANNNNLAIFINDKPIHVIDGVSTSRTANRITVIGNIDGAKCNFDDFKFWNLDDVEISTSHLNPGPTATRTLSSRSWVTDFAEPILAAIKDREPYFQDDFGPNTKGWVSGYNDRPISIEEGVMRLKQGGNVDNIFLRNMPNYVFQVDISRPASCCVHVRLNGGSGSDSSSIYIGPNGWGICRGDNCTGNNNLISQKNEVIVIVRNSQAGFYLAGNPVFNFEDPNLADPGPFGNVSFQCDDAPCEFDNVKFWNLDKVPDLP